MTPLPKSSSDELLDGFAGVPCTFVTDGFGGEGFEVASSWIASVLGVTLWK